MGGVSDYAFGCVLVYAILGSIGVLLDAWNARLDRIKRALERELAEAEAVRR